jgi:hypothetical protein
LKRTIENRGSIGVLISFWVIFLLVPGPAADADEYANAVSVIESDLNRPSQSTLDIEPFAHLLVGSSLGTNHSPEPVNSSGNRDVSQPATASSSQIATDQHDTQRAQHIEKELSKAELLELEQALLAIGFFPGPVDGQIDEQSKQAIRQYQDFAVLWPDGEPKRRLLIELQALVKLLAERDNRGGEAPSKGPSETPRVPNQAKRANSTTDAENRLSSESVSWQKQPLNYPDKPEATGRPSQAIPQPRPKFLKSVASRVTPFAAVSSAAASSHQSSDAGEIANRSTAPPIAVTQTPLPKFVRDAINVRLASGHTPLTKASAKRQQHALKALLEYGANPNLAAQDQATALMYAAWNGDTNSARRLLRAGADPNRRNADGKTALMAAARIGHGDIVALLLRQGAAPDQQTANGWTALMYAVWSNHAEAVQTLIEFRADIRIRNGRGQTAVDLASARKRTRIHALLVRPRSALSGE